MGIITYIRSIFTRKRSANPRSGTNYLDAAGSATPNGSTLNVATAYRCVRLLSESVAALPLRKKSRRNGVMVNTDDHLSYLLSVQPNEWTSAFDFWNDAVQQLILRGNAYIFPVYEGNSDPVRLILATPGTVTHDTINDQYTVNDATQRLQETRGEADVIHLRNLSLTGKTGVGVIAYAMRTIGIATAGDIEAMKKFENGGVIKGILTIRNNGQSGNPFLQNNEESALDVAKVVNEQQRIMNVVPLPGEYDLKQLSMSSAEQQFIENRKFTVLEICRFFGVHPSFVFADTSSNYKSAEMANVAFLVNTLNPLLRRIENELQRKLTGEKLSRHVTFEFDRSGMYACDLESRVKYMTSLLGLGRTVNEIRLMDNLPAVDNGDKVILSANYMTLEQLIQKNSQNTDNNGNDEEKPLSE